MIKHDLPEPSPSMWAAYREVIPTWLRQLQNEDYFLVRKLPENAKPYRPDLHDLPIAAE
jgi:fatty acid desaturase